MLTLIERININQCFQEQKMIWMKKWRKRRNENMCVVCIHHTVRDIICIFFININCIHHTARDIICIFFININYINIKIKKNENKNYFII